MANISSIPYRDCVGILLLNTEGLVWVGKRISKTTGQYAQFSAYSWQMPQGGIDKGETPLEAAQRELKEETGISSFELVAESAHWYHYDLPSLNNSTAFKGKYRGQRQKWFALRFLGQEQEIDLKPKPGHPAEFEDWRWEYGHALPELIVPFKRRVYEQVINEFKPLLKQS